MPEPLGRPPIHLKPAADLAERVLLPGDPHRALAVAEALLERPRMFNHARGLWGYSGTAADGELLTVQSTGMGGPSAAIVAEELIELGARTLVRIGTCGALSEQAELAELLAAVEVMPADGTSAALGAGERLVPDAGLTRGLLAAGARAARVVSTDVFYDSDESARRGWAAAGADAVEMEAAAVLQVAARGGARAACLLAVSDLLAEGSRRRASPDDLLAAGLELGQTAAAALGAGPQGARG